jgi:filamentous hemagglutinin
VDVAAGTAAGVPLTGVPVPHAVPSTGTAGTKSVERTLWGSWNDYPKVKIEGKTYAQVGDRLYTEHAVNRMQPSGLGAPAGELSPGRNISPDIVNEVISSGQPTYAVVDGVSRTVYWSGNVGVVTENDGNLVVTILRRRNP